MRLKTCLPFVEKKTCVIYRDKAMSDFAMQIGKFLF